MSNACCERKKILTPELSTLVRIGIAASRGFPGDLDGKESRPGFDPWVRKIP